jgi:hypothetical protein
MKLGIWSSTVSFNTHLLGFLMASSLRPDICRIDVYIANQSIRMYKWSDYVVVLDLVSGSHLPGDNSFQFASMGELSSFEQRVQLLSNNVDDRWSILLQSKRNKFCHLKWNTFEPMIVSVS